MQRNPTRSVRIGSVSIGAAHPIAIQSMTATHTQDIDATVAQVEALRLAGADVVRIAVDSRKDAEALAVMRDRRLDACVVIGAEQLGEAFMQRRADVAREQFV